MVHSQFQSNLKHFLVICVQDKSSNEFDGYNDFLQGLKKKEKLFGIERKEKTACDEFFFDISKCLRTAHE